MITDDLDFDLNQIKARISQITPLHRFFCPRESHATRLTFGARLGCPMIGNEGKAKVVLVYRR